MEGHSLEIYLSTFTIALLHTMIPSHWLCFVAVGRAQGWRPRQTMGVAALAGLIHVTSTIGLGLLVGFLGDRLLSDETFERSSAYVLVGLGGLYLLLHFLNLGHRHEEDRRVSDRWAFLALLAVVTVSPCTAAIPILVAVAEKTVVGLLLLSGVLLVATVGSMVLLVGLTSLGFDKLQFRVFDRYERLILGLVLAALGGMILLGAG